MARSIKKGPFVAESLLKKVQVARDTNSRLPLKTWSRASVIIPDFVGQTFAVHDGRKFVSVFVTENMVGHRLGEFVLTRTFRMHSGQRQAAAAKK
ncbi:30S ribosomal protein S19 [Candidatus Dependentiae bacterium]|nr:30S ribosomal protein S19 [Candidatus Dependentiae bacterium]